MALDHSIHECSGTHSCLYQDKAFTARIDLTSQVRNTYQADEQLIEYGQAVAFEPMKILMATANRSIVGGVETYLQAVIPALANRGHEIGILYEHRRFPEGGVIDQEDSSIPVWYWDDLLENPFAAEEITFWRPDVVYFHGSSSLDLESFLLANFPCILFAHNYAGTCVSGTKCHKTPVVRQCERELGPACLALYYPRRCGGLNPLTAIKMFRGAQKRNARLKDYSKILVASSHMQREFEGHGVAAKLRLLPYPLTDARFQEAPFSPKMPGDSILFAGRLTDLKGLDYLIRAMPEASRSLGRNLKLTVMGDGPKRASLQEFSQSLGVQADFIGWISKEEKVDVFREAHLLAVPSTWPEPFALVGIEAGCLSVPAVGFDVGGISDWLIPGVSGELAAANPPTVRGLVEAITQALCEPDHYARLCRGAWEASRRFTMDRHLDQFETLAHEVVDEILFAGWGEALLSPASDAL